MICASRATAQGTRPAPPVPPVTPADSLASFERPNGSLLRVGTLTYLVTLTKTDGSTTALGTRTVTVSDSPLGGTPSWLIAESRRGTVVETTDSVSLSRTDLAPERWTATIGRSQLGASFTRDSVFGAVQSYRGRASFALAVPANTLLSAGMVERVLELLPLREGYHAGASLLLVDGLTPRVVPAEIAVERSERVMVGTREVGAWRVTLRWESKEQRLWIGKDDLRVVRTEQALPNGVLTAEVQG